MKKLIVLLSSVLFVFMSAASAFIAVPKAHADGPANFTKTVIDAKPTVVDSDDQVWIPEGKCFEYILQDRQMVYGPSKDNPMGIYKKLNGNDRPLVINTARPLTNDKTKVYRSVADKKILTPLGESILGRLEKMPDVKIVVISNRQILVRIYAFPNLWVAEKDRPGRKAILNDVLDVIGKVLCGK